MAGRHSIHKLLKQRDLRHQMGPRLVGRKAALVYFPVTLTLNLGQVRRPSPPGAE